MATGAHLVSTWTSTDFHPHDSGTRLVDGDALLGNAFRPLNIMCRLLIVGGCGTKMILDLLKEAGWPCDVWWTPARGKKFDLRTNKGRSYLQGLVCSGHVVAQQWWITGVSDLDRDAWREPELTKEEDCLTLCVMLGAIRTMPQVHTELEQHWVLASHAALAVGAPALEACLAALRFVARVLP